MNVKTSSLDSLNAEFDQHWQWSLDEGDCAVIIDTTQKASPDNSAAHHVENKLPSFSSRLWYGSCSSPDKARCPTTSLAEDGYIDLALQIDMEGQDHMGHFDQGL